MSKTISSRERRRVYHTGMTIKLPERYSDFDMTIRSIHQVKAEMSMLTRGGWVDAARYKKRNKGREEEGVSKDNEDNNNKT